MTYHLHRHNSGYYGRRSYNSLAKATEKAQEWVLNGGTRHADITTGRGLDERRRYHYWNDEQGMQYLSY